MTTNEGGNTPNDPNETPEADPIRQLKGEMNRKLEKFDGKFDELTKSNQQLMALLDKATRPAAPQKPAADDDMDKIMYSDPKRFAAIIQEQAETRIMERISNANAAQNVTQTVISELAAEYPELADKNAELTKKAVTILQSLPQHEQSTTAAYRFAVKQAAEDLSVKPRSKRDPDEFMGPSHNPYGAPRRREQSPAKIIERITPLAEAMGVDMSNPETQKRMAERAKRDFKQFDTPLKNRKGK
jgi:hypothetical protein